MSEPKKNDAPSPINYKVIGLFTAAFIAIIIGVFYLSTNLKAEKHPSVSVDPAFATYVSGYTSGVISKAASIRILLAEEFQDSTQIGKSIASDLLKFDPPIKGNGFWVDSKTIEFNPASLLSSGTLYQAYFQLSELLDVPDNLSTFEFNFQTIAQNYDVSFIGLSAYSKTDLSRQKLLGTLRTADLADSSKIKEVIAAQQDGSSLAISWNHQSDGLTHDFVIEQIKRGETASSVSVTHNGRSFDVDKQGDEEIEIPAIGDFKLLSATVVQSPEQFVSLQFSDPLKEKQNLDGLITIGDLRSLRFIIEGNEIKVYPSIRQTGNAVINLFSGILNVQEYKMKQSTTAEILFAQTKPSVRLVGDGVILPSTDGLVLPFEAVSLKSVDVQITKIFTDNVFQFLQVNDLNGSREIRRVGRPLIRKKIKLSNQGVTDLGRWNRFTLDLAEFISSEPGAIYQVQLGFGKEDASYNCPGQTVSEADLSTVVDENFDEEIDEFSYWDGYENYYSNDYDWNERDNPCHSSYYAYGRGNVTKNLLASNLGLIAKLGNNQQLMVSVTDMISALPLNGVNVSVYDYQQQLIENKLTDSEGFIYLDLKKKPFLIVADRNGEKGYLKVDDGNALSLSNFDVSGTVIQKGIKGFLYGERGVWRPGDDIYLTFILEDQESKIPENHPVVFELTNPRGQLKQKLVSTSAIGNMYHFKATTSDEDLTGNWQAKVKVGGATFTKSLKVETIKPNRLKINLDFGKDRITANSPTLNGQLNVKWLHGAPARNMKAEFDVLLRPAKTVFKGYNQYEFDDPSREFYSESQRIFEGNVDQEGNAVMNASIETDYSPPGMLTAYFNGKVFESGGGFSVDRFSIPYYPYTSFVGLQTPKGDRARGMLLTDTLHNVAIATVDGEGNPISRSGLKVEVFKLNWRWWWDQSQDYLSNYVGRSSTTAIKSGTISTTNGKGNWQFKVNYPEWGRFFVRVCDPESGHCSGKIIYMDWPGWAGRAQRESPGGASMLSFSADKESYNVGESVKLSIPGNDNGRALVSIENGSGIVEQHWVETLKGETQFQFEAKAAMAPNVYVNVTLLQPHAQTANDLPIRMYGVVPLTIDNPGTHLAPQIDMKDELEPEKEVSIAITEKDGKPMAYTIAVVDEGLLDLTRFTTPDAWKQFYAKEALGVKTWDIFEDVIGAYGGKLERLLAIGGDGTGTQEDNAKVNRFKPVVQYIGPFFLEKGESKTHRFTMPQYIGSVKTMVVAAHNGAYGKAEKVTPVRQSLMLLSTLPRVLGPGESVALPANIFVSDESIKNVAVSLEANDLFTLKDAATKSIQFNGASDQIVDFSLAIKEQLGAGKVTITAKAGNNTATHDIDIAIRNPNPPITTTIEKLVPAGQSWETTFEHVGMAGTNTAMLEAYSIPPINLEKRLKYLLRYPHGCVEQTVSSVFPQLYLTTITEINDTGKQMIQTNVAAGIARLQSFQKADGGFSYWPGGDYYSEWSTSYVGHFLLEAQAKGYMVPAEMLRKWKQYQRRMARNWRKQANKNRNDLLQAYRLYTLALGQVPEKGAMNRLRESDNLTSAAKWRLAAAYKLIEQDGAARQLISNQTTTIATYQEQSYTYGSNLRDEAMILETLTLLNDKEKGFELMRRIANNLSNKNQWMSTQTTAFCLIAASKYIAEQIDGEGISFEYTLNNESKIEASTALAIARKTLAIEKQKNGKLLFKNNGKNEVYARLVLEGTPLKGDITSQEKNLILNIIYKDLQGKLIDPSKLEQGTNFAAEVTVANPGLRGAYEELALTQIFPSGWEIINNRLDVTAGVNKEAITYQDIRDDRVMTYFNLARNKRKTFRVLLNASYAGKFYLPAVQCEAMYDNSISARKPGNWVEVTKAGVQ